MEVKDSVKFLKQIKKIRHELKYERQEVWSKNKTNFKNNIKTLCGFFESPKGWNLSIIASTFLLDRGEMMPYDQDVWSFSDVISGTEAQGYEVVVFFNKADLDFLSAPALLPIVVHEMLHVKQAARDPKKYATTEVDDDLNRKLETEADAEVRKYSDEFRKQNVMEKILFCYDKRGWVGAKKMADYLFKESQNAFGGGYDQDMTKTEYEAFERALEDKDLDIFIDYFIKTDNSEKELDSFEKAEEKK